MLKPMPLSRTKRTVSLFWEITPTSNYGMLSGAGVLGGIGQEIRKHLLDQHRIAVREGQPRDFPVNGPLYPALRRRLSQLLTHFVDQVIQARGLTADFLAADTRQAEEII